MEIPSICRYCGGKIIKSTTRALYPKGREPIYLCVNCNAYVGCYPDGSPMGKVANTVLRLKRQETHRIFDRFWRELEKAGVEPERGLPLAGAQPEYSGTGRTHRTDGDG